MRSSAASLPSSPARDPLPVPSDPRHQRFADRLLAGDKPSAAYMAAFPNAKKTSASPLAARLRRRPDVTAYLAAVQARAADGAVLTVREKREFLARIVRVPLAALRPEDETDPNGDLVKAFALSEGEASTSRRVEKLDPLAAIKLDNELSGDDPAAQANAELARVLAALGTRNALPTEKF